MRTGKRIIVAALLVAALAQRAIAQEMPAPIVRSHSPGLAAAAAGINIVYVPVRIAVTAVNAILGGFVGFITFGDKAGADAIWGLTSGPQVITPEMLEGTERWHLGEYD